MSNYVSKEVAEGLKRIGFNETTYTNYTDDDKYHNPNKLYFFSDPAIHNKVHGWYNAPDFLSAADWLWEKHGITFVFERDATHWVLVMSEHGDSHYDDDHRNSAIAKAISIIEGRKGK